MGNPITEKTATASTEHAVTLVPRHQELTTQNEASKSQLSKSTNAKPKTIRRLNVGADNQEKVQYAFRLGGAEFVYLLHAENGEWTFKRKHPVAYFRNGRRYYDFGFCGVSNYYHSKLIQDPRFFTDWRWQMEQCFALWKGGTTFYGKEHLRKDPSFRVSIVNQYVFE